MKGILLINKPKGITSFKAVSIIRKLTKEKRVGHTGTLDPIATGVLPILIGRATSLCDYLLTADKRYTATVKCGIVTDTGDITGTIIKERKPNFSKEDLIKAINSFVGEIEQYPPVYSAIKKDGVPLYKLARQGKEVITPKRKIIIHSINLLEFNEKDYSFSIDVFCSKGTYIRSLCKDLGEKLNCGATMSALKRTQTGRFSLEECVDLESLTQQNIENFLKDEELAVSHLQEICVTQKQGIRFSNGGKLAFDRLNKKVEEESFVRIKAQNTFIGIGYADKESQEIKIKCLINPIN